MGVSLNITPIYGAHTDQPALASVLKVDSFTLLLDCGWTTAFDPVFLSNLATVAPTIDAVLLSHPHIAHVGALPYAVAHLSLSAPVFATLPVWRMAQMFMYDAYVSLLAQHPDPPFNLDDVDAAFELAPPDTDPTSVVPPPVRGLHLLKYQQHFPLARFGAQSLVITPHPAGHMLGGTVWSIVKRTETILYAVHLNHRRERHLNPTTLPSFTRPSHLILSATRACTRTESTKPALIVDHIRDAIARTGNVLIPVDTAGRIVELAAQLHEAWKADPQLARTPLVILHELSSRTFDFARSMIEWMSDEVVRRFDISRENLFVFKHIKFCQNIKELDSIPSPLVVLASSVSMEIGFSRQLFVQWCSRPENAVILVDQPEPDTLCAKVQQHCLASREREEAGEPSRPLKLQVTMRGKEYLQGEELEQWREEERAKKALEEEEERQREEQARLEREAAQREQLLADEALAEQYAREHPDASVVKVPAAPAETLEEAEERYDRIVLAQLRRLEGVPAKPSVDIFPFEPRPRPMWDEYGQEIDTVRFMIGEDPGEGAPVPAAELMNGTEDQGEGADALEEEIPTKYVEELVELTVACHLAIVDCSGLSDGDSLKRLVKEVEPRHVTLIGGTAEEISHFGQYLLSNLYSASATTTADERTNGSTVVKNEGSLVVMPKEMETIDITSNTSVFDFTLHDALVRELKWNQVSHSSISFLDATVLDAPDENGTQILGQSTRVSNASPEMMEVDGGEQRSSSYQTDLIKASHGHPTVYVGTIMMNALKDRLRQAGIKAEFAGGALCIENTETGAVVLVKKVGAQRLSLEGAFSEEYLLVRDLIYDELVIPW